MSAVMKSLNIISRCQAIFRNEKLQSDELMAQHHAFVLNICAKPGRSQEEIAQDICLNKSTVARTLTSLEERGYIKRVPVPGDKRQLAVWPTDRMLEILPQIRAIAREWNTLISQDISEEEMEIFHSVLSRMEASARKIVKNQEEKTR